MSRPYLTAHRRKSLERLRKNLVWCKKDLQKEIDLILEHHWAEEYAYQGRENALKLFGFLICADKLLVRTDMQLKGRGVHKINDLPKIQVVKDDKPGYHRGEEAVYFYHLVVDK
jgi:hypothetical protein